MADNTAVALFEPQNVQTISQLAPKSYNENTVSHDRCLETGDKLLARVKEEGMSDALDMEIAKFLEKTKLTMKRMNERRSPVTQLFDRIRKAYTSMENEIDPTKADSVPHRLQVHRNEYARRKVEQEERRRREEAARIAKENAKTAYRSDVEEDYNQQFAALVNSDVNKLTEMDKSVTLGNYELIYQCIKDYDCELPKTWCQTVVSGARRPAELTPDECTAIQASVMAGLMERYRKQFPFEVQNVRDDILDRLPSKKEELERMAKASAEEAARIKANMEAKEREEAARKEAERRDREKQEAADRQLAAKKQQMDGLFGMPVAPSASYQPKTQVRKKAAIEKPDDIMKIVAFWWSQEGCRLSLDDLCKEFKKQINYVNAAANSKDKPVFITGIRYDDEIKAK